MSFWAVSPGLTISNMTMFVSTPTVGMPTTPFPASRTATTTQHTVHNNFRWKQQVSEQKHILLNLIKEFKGAG